MSIMVINSNFLTFMSSNTNSTRKIWSRLKDKFKNYKINSGKVDSFKNISIKAITVHHLKIENMKSETDQLNLNNKKTSYHKHIIDHNNINHLRKEYLFPLICLGKICRKDSLFISIIDSKTKIIRKIMIIEISIVIATTLDLSLITRN